MSSIKITDGVARSPICRFNAPVDFSLNHGEQLAIVGRNGAGKSLLVDMILGKYPLLSGDICFDFGVDASSRVYENVKYISFRDTYGDSEVCYYQQRWNSQDAEVSPVVSTLLPKNYTQPFGQKLMQLLGVDQMLHKYVVSLSSGELRKFQIVRTLLSNPRVLIIDNPFIGLDASTRVLLQETLQQLIAELPLQIVLVISKCDILPEFVTHVVEIENRICKPKVTRGQFLACAQDVPAKVLAPEVEEAVCSLPVPNTTAGDEMVRLNNVSIRYAERTILKNLNWEVRRGERWALSGQNGSGKSTLLSLICADNPQSYACDISLFGRKRGSGESIWDIKKRIGYVCPEMHRTCQQHTPVIKIVASGLKDSIGLYQKPSEQDIAVSEWWMDVFGISHLKDQNFMQISSGEQRLALLARAFVKDPELIILDEPLHGLDLYNRQLVKEVIEAFCSRVQKTMIMVTHYQEELPKCITHHLHLEKQR